MRLVWLISLGACLTSRAQEVLPVTQPGAVQGELSTPRAAGTNGLIVRETAESDGEPQKYWRRDFSSVEAYDKSVEPNRERLRLIIGAVDARLPVTALEFLDSPTSAAKLAETDSFTVRAVRWPVLNGVFAEGLWLEPKGTPIANVVAVPDADQTPEILTGLAPGLAPEHQFARRLAENGCAVLVPVLIDRQPAWPGTARTNLLANTPRREWIYRQALPVGRHVIGYEVQEVLAAVDFLAGRKRQAEDPIPKLGVIGYAEGGLVAFYAAALDRRIEAAVVSGYFDSRQGLWEEPIYRNVFGLLPEFGDAEIASLIAPRALIIEHSAVPHVEGPPVPGAGTGPGRLQTPDYESVETEFERARALLKPGEARAFDRFRLITGAEGMTTGPGSDRALAALLEALGVPVETVKQPGKTPVDSRVGFDPGARQRRQVKQLEDYTQKLLHK